MSDLVKWQVASLVSRFIAVGAGIVQGIFVVRLLSPSDYGLVGIVASVGSVIGVYQHLGLASGTIREISARGSREDAFKVFVSSFSVRFLISFPLALGLFFFSGQIAKNIYNQSQIVTPLKIYALILLLQGTQDISNAALAGLQKFSPILIYQVLIAFFSLGSYVFLISRFGFDGYFLAMLLVTAVGSLALLGLSLGSFRDEFTWPSRGETLSILKNVFKVGLAIYVVKIIFTFWQHLGPLFLGTRVTAAEVGFFNFALFYASKLLPASDALSTINLPVMTKKFVENIEQFKIDFMKNFYKVYSFIWVAAVAAIFWGPEIIRLVVGNKYDNSLILILPLVLAFFAYCFVNLLGASVIVPAKLLWQMITYYAVLIGGTLVAFFALKLKFDPLLAIALATMIGGISSLATLLFFAKAHLRMTIFDQTIWELTGILLPLLAVYLFDWGMVYKSLAFLLLVGLYLFWNRRKGIFDIFKMTRWVLRRVYAKI